MQLESSVALVAVCFATLVAGACGGSTDRDASQDGTAGAAGAGGTGGTGTGGVGGTGGTPPACGSLGETACATAEHCAPLYRNDQLIPGSPPPPPDFGQGPDPCCIGCQQPSCSGCHVPSFVGCRGQNDCDKSEAELCGYFPDGVCP
jgi:hypothetical protein